MSYVWGMAFEIKRRTFFLFQQFATIGKTVNAFVGS